MQCYENVTHNVENFPLTESKSCAMFAPVPPNMSTSTHSIQLRSLMRFVVEASDIFHSLVRRHATFWADSITCQGWGKRNTKNETKEMNQRTLGEFIKERRQFRELSQRKLAEMIGLKAASHLCDVENGYRQLGEEHLPLLAKALDVTMEELQNHDPRAPLTQAQKLIERDPAYITSLNRMVRMAGELSPQEIERRLAQTNPVAEPAPLQPKPQPEEQ